MAKTSFNEFLLAVAPEHRVFVEKLNDKLLEQGCELVIKRLHCHIPAGEENRNELGVSQDRYLGTHLRR